MFKFLALVALAAVASAGTLSREVPRSYPWSPTGRIVGGEDTTIEEVPYQVSIRAYGSHSCGGSIIAKYWVLTAGHCVDYSPSVYTIIAGTTDRTKGGSHHSAALIMRHEKFGYNRYGILINDVGLIRVNEPFEFDETCQSISLFEDGEESPPGAMAIITGWGSTGGWELPTILQTVSVPIVTKQSCSRDYIKLGGLPAGQICAGYPEGKKDACQGDSGGPLALEGRLAGIVSWGNGCALPGQPGVYTEVAAYREWIRSKSGI